MSNSDKIYGMMYGCALGDALGAPFEFRNSKNPLTMYTGKLDRVISRNSQFQGKRESALGQITDDTEMTLALSYSIIQGNEYNKTLAIEQYLKWANSKCSFMGNNTRKLLYGIKTIKSYNKRYETMHKAPQKEWTQSNGCMMRACPLALISHKTYLEYVKEDCMITNPHPICIEANSIYVTLLKNLLDGKSINTSIKSASKLLLTDEVKQVILDGIARTPRDIEDKKGWILHALYCVFYVLAGNHNTFAEGIDEVILLGGDTDTNGLICGAVLGLIHGYDKMNKEIVTLKNINILKQCDVSTGTMQRPDEYTTKNLDETIDNLIVFYENQ